MNTGSFDHSDSEKSTYSLATPQKSSKPGEQVVRIQVESVPPTKGRWWSRILMFALMFSIMMNLTLFSAVGNYFGVSEGPTERYHSGSKTSQDKIAVITISGTIMPPFTERTLEQIKKAREDAQVHGVVLVVDSPGGLVADSHQIYHQLSQLAAEKTVYVQMQRLAASGGYYVSMAAGKNGKIFAEPTTWTGSIGVIIPHYNLTDLAEKVGVKVEPLTTGEFKDSLSSFKPLSERDREVWTGIIDDAYQRFLSVIESGRPELSRQQIESTATGRIFTADQAKSEGLVDEIGYLEETIQQLQTKLGLDEARVVEYRTPPTLADVLMGDSQAKSELSLLKELVQSPAPRAFYLMGSQNLTVTP